MSKKIHRQIGKLGSRSADEASVAMIIKEVDDADVLLGKLVEHTKTWRDSWTNILVHETRIADSLHDVYQTIPRTGDSTNPPPETPEDILHRVALLHTTYNDLKEDMMEEVVKVDTLLIGPMTTCRGTLKPVKKAIEKRDNKKLDFERYQKQVDHSKGKKSKSDREYSVQSRAEMELEKATTAYEIADDYLREYIPPILAKIIEFLPLVVEISVQIQFTLLQHSYSTFYHYANENGFTDSEGETVIAEWEDLFLPVQKEVESSISSILHGKAILMPMAQLSQENVIKAKVSGMSMPSLGRGNLGRGKKPPPPPAPEAAPAEDGDSSPARGREYSRERPSIGKQRSSASIGSKISRRDQSPPPPVPNERPAIRGKISSANLKRDESPPPPLPGPRPTSNDSNEDSRPNSFRSGGSYGGGSVTPTPLAGLKPSQLRGGASHLKTPESDGRPALISTGRISSSSTIGSTTKPTTSQTSLSSLVAGKKKPPPPPPKKKFGGPKEVWVKAIFAFDGQDANDLSFGEGERIKVVKKTDSTDDWWEGELNGRKGTFPANYTEPTT
ncbi:hypothetical protein EDC01DRAFT_656173 [Geopyxis carbonaria]|nr:hypothetical protein EDC01DRAFT_656173 [Geopyxis carbonaria]